MIAALIIGKHKSMGCPGKNVRPVLGRPMVEYAFLAAKHSRHVNRIFTSTDSPHIVEIGKKYGADWIERPAELATPEALTEDALEHAVKEIERRAGEPVELIALFFANAPTIPIGMIDQAVEVLRKDPTLDSAFTVCKYDMWAPLRARKVNTDGLIQPYIELDKLGDVNTMSSIRGGEGSCYFVDLAVQVLRPQCIKDWRNGPLPFRWMGKRSHALPNDFGFDIDYEWQIPVIEHWLTLRGFTESTTPYPEA